jgi:hypothetical protein
MSHQKRTTVIIGLFLIVGTTLPLIPAHADDAVNARLCARVVREFGMNAMSFARVNARIQERLGVTCSTTQQSSSMRKSSKSSVISSSSISSASSSASSVAVSSESSSAQTTTLSCAGMPASCLKGNLDYWDTQRAILTKKGSDMSHQTSNGCLKTIATIDNDYVVTYNNYLSAYNNYYGDNVKAYAQSLTTVELHMRDVITSINGAPSFCY